MEERISKEQVDRLEAGQQVTLSLEQTEHLIKFLPHASIIRVYRVPASNNLYQVQAENV